MSGSARKTRKCLTISENINVIKEIRNGRPVKQVASVFGISVAHAYRIFKRKTTLETCQGNGIVPSHSKIIVNKAKHREIDEAVFEWFYHLRKFHGARKPLPVSRALIEARAKHEAKRRGIKTFNASDGWFSRWRWRYRLSKCKKLHGEAGDVSIQSAEEEMEKLRESLKGFDVSNVFNMDELGLFYRTIPSRSVLLECEGDKRQHGRGLKQMKAKDRITVIMSVNATGTCKIPLVVIGSSKNPRCFKRSKPCLSYYSQANAWNDKVTYNKWWYDIFLPQVRRVTKEPVALIIDGFSGHDMNCHDPINQIQVFKLPPNVTSIYQPLDQGIIAALKINYRSKLLERLVLNADKFSQLQLLAQQLPAGCAGLDYVCPAHIADAMTILKQVWDDMSTTVIAGCWHHSHCLPVLNEVEVTEMRNYHKTLKTDVVMSMCSLLSNLNLKDSSVHEMLATMGLDVHRNELKDMASKVLDKWLDVEEMAILDVDGNNDGDDSASVSQVEPLEKVKLLKMMIPMLHEMHSIGAKVEDNVIIDMALNVCVHILDSV